MSAPMAVACPRCGTASADQDHYCAGCGLLLARPRLSQDHLVVEPDSRELSIQLENAGVRPAFVVVREADAAKVPDWIRSVSIGPASGSRADADAGGQQTLAAGEGATLVPHQPLRLSLTVSPEALARGHVGHHELDVVTSVLQTDPASSALVRKVCRLTLATAGRARARPGGVWLRLVPRTLAEGGRDPGQGAVKQTLVIKNEGGHPIELGEPVLVDDPRPVFPPNWVRLAAPVIAHLHEAPAQLTLQPGQEHAIDVELSLAEGALEPGAIGVFALVCTVPVASQPEVRIELGGVVADGPTLTTDAELPLIVRCQGRPTQAEVTLTNPGCAPVRVRTVEVLPEPGPAPEGAAGPEDAEPSASEDASGPPGAWLSAWLGDDVLLAPEDQLLAPGQSATLTLRCDPGGREPAFMEAPWGQAVIRIHHDGFESVESRHLDLPIRAELGRVRVLDKAVLGVDFGTSYSSTSLLYGESGRAYPIGLDPAAARDELASLLFFRGHPEGAREGAFLFGQAAENAASLRWANLVRSIKSVIARDPAAVWTFLGQERGRVATYRSQDLLEAFITELKTRAEVGIRSLPADLLEELDLSASGARFDHVVFTHPVGASDEVVGALLLAARRAKLVPDDADLEQFRARHCLDEALAASVAFAYVTAGAEHDALGVSDDEQMICIDVGGGTTDFAAVRLEGLRSFRAGERNDVELTLMASGGDDHFGGEDIDRLLATRVLEKAEGQPVAADPDEATGSSTSLGELFDTEAIRRALSLPSFESFRRHEVDRVEASGLKPGPEVDRAAQVAFSAASDLLRACEQAKRTLGEQEHVRVAPQVSDWPTRPGRPSPPAGMRLDVDLARSEVGELYAGPIARCTQKLEPLVEGAGWSWPDVGLLLFTGQGSRLFELREKMQLFIRGRREADATAGGRPAPLPLRVVEPDGLARFDPKHCVAMGAAVWGDSQSGGGGWLRIRKRTAEVLSYSLSVRRGPRFVVVDGLEAGAPFVVRATHTFSAPTSALTLYKERRLLWTFPLPSPQQRVEIVLESDHAAHVVLEDGARVEGQRSLGDG